MSQPPSEEEETCPHENVQFVEGNWVPPYGWETCPGNYCLDCGEMVEEDDRNEPDPDAERQYRKEND